MKKAELKVILEAQLPKSYQLPKASSEDEQQESSNAAAQQESLKAAAQQEPSKATPPKGCASPEYEALFVAWPFKAPPRAQTPMPSVITSLVDSLSTKEERIIAKQLWNPSLPVSANVGIIQYNRVDGDKFKEKVGEEWWRRLEDLATELNEAAGVIKRKDKELEGKALDDGMGKGKGPEMKTVELPEGKGGEFEMKIPKKAGGKAKEPKAKTPDHLAEASGLVVKTEEGPNPKAATSTTEESKKALPDPNDETTEAANRLFIALSSTPATSPPDDPSVLAASNPLSALWYLITRFFSSGYASASNFFVALEASIRLSSTTIHPLHIPAPPSFWTSSVDWKVPKTGLTLLLTLASSEQNMFLAFTQHTKSLGAPAPTASEMRQKMKAASSKSASLRKAVLCAKACARDKGRTTVLGVEVHDVQFSALCERHGKGAIEEHFATFGRMFVLGICAEGAKLWLVGGEWGEVSTVWESNEKVGAGLGTWEEMDEFVRAFEGFAVSDGQWNTKRFKWFHRCFAVDLKQFDLQISAEEKKKRGLSEKKEGVKRLLNEIEAWVEIYKIEDVKAGDVGKFTWL